MKRSGAQVDQMDTRQERRGHARRGLWACNGQMALRIRRPFRPERPDVPSWLQWRHVGRSSAAPGPSTPMPHPGSSAIGRVPVVLPRPLRRQTEGSPSAHAETRCCALAGSAPHRGPVERCHRFVLDAAFASSSVLLDDSCRNHKNTACHCGESIRSFVRQAEQGAACL